MNPDHHVSEDRLRIWCWAGWEPHRHYRRIGSKPDAPFLGGGAWLEPWRDRLGQRQTLEKLADAGITHLVTYCYKGFGLQVDRTEWPWLKSFVQSAHELGMKVLGYVQGGSLYPETFLLERPDAADWVSRSHEGKPQYWGGAYYRWSPCLLHGDYLAYMEQVVRAAITELSLDGISLDNNYYKHCWCERCASQFRRWLTDRGDLESLTGLPRADAITPPPLPETQDRFFDPLQLLWMEFGVQIRLSAMRRIHDAVKRASPTAYLVGNPAFPRKAGIKARLALDPSRESAVTDALYAENGNLARMGGEGYVTQAEAYLLAEAGGYDVFSTAWKKHGSGPMPPTTAGEIWTVMAEEFSHAAAVVGNNWALRASGDGDGLFMDDAPLFDAFAQASGFFRQLHAKASLAGRRPWSELAVVIHPDTFTIMGSDLAALRALQQELLRRHWPARYVFSDQSLPGETRAVLAWQQTSLTDEAMARLAQAGRRGVKVMVVGRTAILDGMAWSRNAVDVARWLASDGFSVHAAEGQSLAATQASEKHLGTDITRPTPAAVEALDAVMAASGWRPSLQVDAPLHALVKFEQAADGRRLIHWRDQSASGQPITGCSVRLDKPSAGRVNAIFHQPQADGSIRTTPLAWEDGAIHLPAFTHYGLLVMG